jgi:hypothetical protein
MMIFVFPRTALSLARRCSPPLHQPVQPYTFTEAEVARLIQATASLTPTSGSPLRPAVYRLAIVLLYTPGCAVASYCAFVWAIWIGRSARSGYGPPSSPSPASGRCGRTHAVSWSATSMRDKRFPWRRTARCRCCATANEANLATAAATWVRVCTTSSGRPTSVNRTADCQGLSITARDACEGGVSRSPICSTGSLGAASSC